MTNTKMEEQPVARKGAMRRADVPIDILAQLNKGTLAPATLPEELRSTSPFLCQTAPPKVVPGILQVCRV